jgi:acyl carrier protein
MSKPDIKQTLYESLRHVAPEADPATLAPAADLREELDLDSMDFLNFVTRLHEVLGIEIPEADYRRLFSLAQAESYLAERLL